ncbi:hypothetical protein BLOT_014727 [Blomia tropicalis]|nr:hypothetical protein BLOT_014727 [Blomia tropicalis]
MISVDGSGGSNGGRTLYIRYWSFWIVTFRMVVNGSCGVFRNSSTEITSVEEEEEEDADGDSEWDVVDRLHGGDTPVTDELAVIDSSGWNDVTKRKQQYKTDDDNQTTLAIVKWNGWHIHIRVFWEPT